MKKIYISGKITGVPIEQAREKFAEAEKILMCSGWETVNPMKNGLPETASWKEHMVKDIEMLLDCEAILMLSCWRTSKGAKIEKAVAEQMGMQVLTFKEKII
ncbi:DUF4406 domain-containing protein [Dyadobacter sp. CY347]|uniref:DUF4406 domain-containing protein n=1 Tax=Dyadobacter sp. CY347 TaxID=2909336 RepID=UPI001F1BAF43|nr:DUF4406 domain-containing protein [Dyadobacter sp. CY347]MCF2487483.1 DUF4406 domain-containing protein [Dyadobacter sp. CY347]